MYDFVTLSKIIAERERIKKFTYFYFFTIAPFEEKW